MIKDKSKFENYRQRRMAEAEFDRVHGPRQYRTVQLPKADWGLCTRCDGKGQYLMSGDLHRSEGWVPCNCHGGIVKEKVIEIKRRVRVKAGSQRT